jgi:aspartyl-tRNA(Asn)/glutamyl-tRNA(Gln) amidotransferase subunit A
VESAIRVLKKLGANVQEVSFPSMRYMDAAWTCIVRAEGYTYHEYNLRHRLEDFGENVRYKLSAGSLYSAADYIQSQRARQVIKAEFQGVMEGVDALVMPTTVKTAERLDEYNIYNPSWTGNITRTFDMTGQPAVSVPCGFNAQGLPIGFMIAGRAFDEATVLRVAHTYQRNTKWTEKRPSV